MAALLLMLVAHLVVVAMMAWMVLLTKTRSDWIEFMSKLNATKRVTISAPAQFEIFLVASTVSRLRRVYL